MIYKVVIMCLASESDAPTYYRLKVEADNPDNAFDKINKFMHKTKINAYKQALSLTADRQEIYKIIKSIKHSFYIVEMHQSNDDFKDGPIRLEDCRLLKRKKNV